MKSRHKHNSTLHQYRDSVFNNYPYDQEDLAGSHQEWLDMTEEHYLKGTSSAELICLIAANNERFKDELEEEDL